MNKSEREKIKIVGLQDQGVSRDKEFNERIASAALCGRYMFYLEIWCSKVGGARKGTV